jgi:predicted permease
VGIAPPGFNGIQVGRVPDLYLPITMKAQITPKRNGLDDRKDFWVILLGRLSPGISREQAEAGVNATYRPILENDLRFQTNWNDQQKKQFVGSHISLHKGSKGRPIFQNFAREPLIALMAMVGLVLFIACANVAGLLTARGVARGKEITVRLVLGASRWRLVRQLIVEACVLSFTAALFGLVIASWTTEGLVRFASENIDATGLSSSLNLPMLFFAVGLALLCGFLFGIVPALRATRVPLAAALKDQAGSLSSGLAQARLRKGLVISQVALTLLLVTAAARFARSVYNLQHVDLGLRPSQVLQFSLAPGLNGYDTPHSIAFFRQLEDRLAVLPGIQSVSAAEVPVLAGDSRGANVRVEGEPPEQAGTIHIRQNSVGPAYFSTMGIALLRGREFTRQDGEGSPQVAIINESMARKFFGEGDPVGRHMAFGGAKTPLNIKIVGVVKDSKHMEIKEEAKPFAYIPYSQDPAIHSLTYYVRTRQNPEVLADAARKTVQALDSSLPVYEMRAFQSQIERSISAERLVGFLALAFGTLAASLAALGIYALLAYTVTQRTREMGVRMALGAGPRQVRGMIVKDTARLMGVGILIGLPVAYGLSRLTQSLLYEVKSFDLFSFVVALAALALIGTIAGYAPARRATRIDPMKALRHE